MKWGVQFPEEELLIMRPCLRRACTGNKHAAALLSYLLYHACISQEFKQLPEQHDQSKEVSGEILSQSISISIYKTQQQILTEMDHMISERTLRDVAIPLLIACGYIDIAVSKRTYQYTVHLTQIQTGITTPPTKEAILPTLHQLTQSGNISGMYRQYFRHRPAELPPDTGKIAEFSGNIADVKNGHESTPEEGSSPIFHEDKSKSNKDITKRREEATKDTHSQWNESETIKAATSSLAAHLQDHQITLNAPVHQSDIQKPETAEGVVQRIEVLRGHPFGQQERPRQLHAAQKLLGLEPKLNVNDIQEAWLHGSDSYWKQHRDACGMTVLDLANHDSRGKRRVHAILEHKRHRETCTFRQPVKHTLESPPKISHSSFATTKVAMTKQEAQQLTVQVKQDGHHYDYKLQAEPVYRDTAWVVNIQLEQHTFTIHSPAEWSQKFPQIQQVMHLKGSVSNTENKEQSAWIA
ncbi:hypothetical protein KDW_30630 [Dictyobacter vulcani]|uniref:Uncharacterized protein n=1 Tax=Dictyobacter vulcani TaxID=2607529 RepID=A0A5J4KR64_9CHLR|nr:hypothetical protein [Dictyobacter vulcani]GER88901.1 hypothetical protein KDW_30630 [Dictyobacter vulcani]